jgi:hypothetical protein
MLRSKYILVDYSSAAKGSLAVSSDFCREFIGKSIRKTLTPDPFPRKRGEGRRFPDIGL